MSTSSCHVRIPNFEFEPELVEEARRTGRLLSMEIELSLKCNFRCPYCYVPDGHAAPDELSHAEIVDVISQARDLGARKIILLGGEPMVYPSLFDVIDSIRGMNLGVEMFTNGTNVTATNAQRLFESEVCVALKMNSFDEKIQDRLAGKQGAYQIIRTALRNLQAAGYPREHPFLAISTVICRQNISEMTRLWRWLRDQKILPYLELITPRGSARRNSWLDVPPAELGDLFEEIAKIDGEEYGQVWEAQPPLVGNACLRHSFSCLVSSTGHVNPCVGVPISVGNIREARLADILRDSEVIGDLRNHQETIKGPCRTCDRASGCYGCRGAAYNLTGDYLASDPLCWRNTARREEIDVLPAPAQPFVPQSGPMRVIDTLLSVGERRAEASLTVHPEMPFINDDGSVDEAIYLEMIAQSMAAANGFRERGNGANSGGGLLLGAKKLRINGIARVGDELKVSVVKTAKFGDFGLIEGRITRNGKELARGEVKVYHQTSPKAGGEQDRPR